jgi:hypothetical protein
LLLKKQQNGLAARVVVLAGQAAGADWVLTGTAAQAGLGCRLFGNPAHTGYSGLSL